MDQFFDLILSNEIYLVVVVLLIIAVIFSIVKKVMKLLMYAFILLAAFLGYVYYTGSTIPEVLDPVKEKVGEAEKTLQENKELQEAKKKIEKEIKK